MIRTGFEPMRQFYPPTRFPIVLLRPARTTLQLTNSASRARTYDIMINSHALCQLSYCGIINPLHGNDLLSQDQRSNYHRR